MNRVALDEPVANRNENTLVLEAECRTRHDEIEKYEKNIQRLTQEYQDFLGRMKPADSALLKSELAAHHDILGKMRAEYQDKVRQLDEALGAKQRGQALVAAKQELGRLERELTGVKSSLENLQAQAASLPGRITFENWRLQQLLGKLAVAKDQVAALSNNHG